ncbi:MAG: MFS transporter [Anaerolineae bacterium]|nr:MFS transporter [Anaerolineae bacterium]
MHSTKDNHWPSTGSYFAVFSAVGLVTAALGPTLPGLAAQAGVDLDAISLLFTANSVGYLAGSFVGGRQYDRIAGHRVIAAALGLMIGGLALIPLLSSRWLLVAAWLAVGTAGGALDVGGNTLIVWLHGRGVGPYMNGLHFFFGVGSFIGPLIAAAALAIAGDATRAYWVLALLLVPLALWIVRVPSPTAGDDSDDAERMLDGSARRGTQSRDATVVLVALFLLLYVGAEVAFGGWIYTYAAALGLATATSAATLTSAFWGALTVGRLAGIPIAARYRPRTILLVDLAGCLLSVGLILALPSSRTALWAGTIALGATMASIFPAAITLAGNRVRITGRITAWFLIGSSIGSMTVPWLIGQLFEPIGPHVTMWAILATLVADLAVLVVLLLYSEREQDALVDW